ncbi:MlaE family ABC transporter permease [Vulgatibacter incomptus]|uniref:ABC transporter permease protein n=1 Tax=Vulgatibacter incomptus TaxID=1391653 RepID=A0A0K1PDU9_9BACT|nr:ABC transporter permease [Vulgatibacter incomptus]AKU91289.1 ABC transporter permease protein [Vulgatibacter incomptus]
MKSILRSIAAVLGYIGDGVLLVLSDLGGMAILATKVAIQAIRPPYRLGNFLSSFEAIGVGSISVVVLTAIFTGAVFGVQTTLAFRMFNAQGLVGAAVALSLTRELAPVLTGLMVTGRAGSAIATELGSMRVTEQIDALATMAVNPLHYLLVPRVIAGLLALPILTMIFDVVGVFGAYVVAVLMEGISEAEFWSRIQSWVDLEDVFGGLVKAAVFGLVISLSACFKGFYAGGGAKGVGVATTQAVVMSSVLILVLDYWLTNLMMGWWSRV